MNTTSITRLFYCAVLFVFLSGFYPAQQKSKQAAGHLPGEATRIGGRDTAAPSDYVIGLEDVLSIGVWKEPDLSAKDLVVRPDGKISLPLINDIQASGLTTLQLQQEITERLKKFVASPNVSVMVTKIVSQSVSIVGAVTKPGNYPMGSPMTVLELLARSGGFREEANPKRIKIVRKEGGTTVQFPFNYKEIVEGKNLQQNITLINGDVVIVP